MRRVSRCGRVGRYVLYGLTVVVGALPIGAGEGGDPDLSRPSTLVGATVAEVLDVARAGGLDIVSSDRLVGTDLRVSREPSGSGPVAVLRSLLAEHGLDLVRRAGRLVVVRRTGRVVSGRVVDAATGDPVPRTRLATLAGSLSEADERGRFTVTVDDEVDFLVAEHSGYRPTRVQSVAWKERPDDQLVVELESIRFQLSEEVVAPSYDQLARSAEVSLEIIGRDVVATRPAAIGDVVRALQSSVGVAANDLSAQFSIRGGRTDEVLFLIDGLEIYEPYHLKDAGSALSIITPHAVESAELYRGGYSARWGDRLSGLLNLTTVHPDPTRRAAGRASISALDMSLAAGGSLAPELPSSWFAAARIGLLRSTIELVEGDEDPRFNDLFAKASVTLAERHVVEGHALVSRDEFDTLVPGEQVQSSYNSNYGWLRHRAGWGGRWFADSVASVGRFTDRRRGVLGLPQVELADLRDVDMVGLRTDWTVDLGPRNSLAFGAGITDLDSSYDYRRRTPSQPGDLDFLRSRGGRQDHLYASHRAELGARWTFEAGLRFHESRLIDDEHLSPRLSLAWRSNGASSWRASWGVYHQSLRPYELEVADGEREFPEDERSEQAVLGWQWSRSRRLRARVEAYWRRIGNPRVRYENLLDPWSRFPEVAPDRVAVQAERSEFRGVESTLEGTAGELTWSWTAAWSEALDRGVGSPGTFSGRVSRPFDQPFATRGEAVWRPGPRWLLAANVQWRRGWPTTPFELGEPTDDPNDWIRFGALYSERLADPIRLDLRAERSYRMPRGELSLAFDLLNLFGRTNPQGFQVRRLSVEDTPQLISEEIVLGGPFANVTATWSW